MVDLYMLCVIYSYFWSVKQHGGPDVALVGYIMEGRTEVELANSKYQVLAQINKS